MGFKKKWIDRSDELLHEHLLKIEEIVRSIFKMNNKIDVENFDKKVDMEYALALVLNCKISSSEEKQFWSFGADDVVAVKLKVENNQTLKYWGKINWLSTPKDYECYNSYQDPFYAEFKLDSIGLKMENAMFGDYEKSNLDGTHWTETEINWMFEL